MAFRQGLRIDRIERATGNRLAIESTHERIGVDNRSARAIDQERARLHALEGGIVHELAGLRHEWWVQADEIRLSQELVQISLFSATLPGLLDERIEEEDAHPEPGC